MAWNDSVVVLSGTDMFNTGLLIGQSPVITSARGGSGTVEPDSLERQTGLVDERQTVQVMGIEELDGGKRVKLQLSNRGLEEGYILNQIMAYASLAGAPERPLFIMQDERGIAIPSWAENPNFLLEIYGVLKITNKVRLTVTTDPAGLVTLESVQQLIAAHNADGGAHPDLLAAIAAGSCSMEEAAVTIPTAGWRNAGGAWPYQLDLPCEQASAKHIPRVLIHKDSLDAASACGLCPEVEALDGVLRFAAKEIPAAALSATVYLITFGGGTAEGGGAYVLPVAGPNTLGGIKSSDSVIVDPDGTAHAFGEVSEKHFATDEEVRQALDNTFGAGK